MVTFEQARSAVRPRAARHWSPDMGTMVVATDGYEDASFWRVRVVAQEELDGDRSFMQMDEIVYLVDKETGDVTSTTYLARQDQIDGMVPYPGA